MSLYCGKVTIKHIVNLWTYKPVFGSFRIKLLLNARGLGSFRIGEVRVALISEHFGARFREKTGPKLSLRGDVFGKLDLLLASQ